MKLNIVPASMGWQWVKLGVKTFRNQPMALSALFFLGMAAMSLASLIPFVGTPLALALLPTFSLVMMVAAAEASQNRMPTMTLLLVAFRTGRDRMRAMALLGVFYAIGFGLMMGVSTLIDGGNFARVYMGGTPMTPELAQDSSFQAAMWLAMVFYLPLSLLFWHAPALVHWHGITPVKAMFFSIVACMRNFGAFLLYGIGWMGIFIVAGMVLALMSLLLAGLLGEMAVTLVVPFALMLAAVFFTSTVFSFRDCFSPPQTSAQPSSSTSDGDGDHHNAS